jgi:hypothetical protein
LKKAKKKTKEQLVWQKKHPDSKASFAWTLVDYKVWQLSPPDCFLKSSVLTEGEQLNNSEIETWFTDSIKTLKILKETDPPLFRKIYQGFVLDVKYLISINKMEKEILNFIQDETDLDF